MKKLWSIRNLLLAVATLGCLTASAAAEAKTLIYFGDYSAPAPVRIYEPTVAPQVIYPNSCYYVHEDYLGHHTWRVKPECTRPVVYERPAYIAPRPIYVAPPHVWHDNDRYDDHHHRDDDHGWDHGWDHHDRD